MHVAGPYGKVVDIIKGLYGVRGVHGEEDKESGIVKLEIEASVDRDIRKEMFFSLAKAGYPIMELRSIGYSLEEVFLQLTTEEDKVDENVDNIQARA